jgi:hypothetical protein
LGDSFNGISEVILMPVVFSNPTFPFQVGANPANQAWSVQLNYRQMIGEVTSWNPNFDPFKAGRAINNYYRDIIDRRSWYGLKVRGIATVPTITSSGQATFVSGNPTVTGVGTAWTPALIGLQFRAGFTFPYQTITAVNPGLQTLTLDTPYAGTSGTSPYQIVAAWITFGGNVKRLMWAINQLQGWPINVKTKVEELNAWDTWRTSLGWVEHFASRPPTPDGQFQVEIWPTPYAFQVFPFEAYTQPADMQLDTDCPVAWISSRLIVERAIADALTIGGPKKNDYYDPTTAGLKVASYEKAIERAEWSDEGLEQQAVMWDYGDSTGGTGDGNGFSQSHDVG